VLNWHEDYQFTLTTALTTDPSQPGYNTSLLLIGDEQLKKLQ